MLNLANCFVECLGVFEDNPQFNRTVNAALAASVAMLSCGLHKYEGFKHNKTFVDVGGGVGKALGVLVSSYPQMHGINSDQPHVVADAPNIPGMYYIHPPRPP